MKLKRLIQIAEEVFRLGFNSKWSAVHQYCVNGKACADGLKALEEAISKSGGDISVRGMIEEVGDECFYWFIGLFLAGKDLREADLEGADLEGADLREADLRGANLKEADLWGADLRGANLQGANLKGASLQAADLRGANLRGADLRGAKLKGADLWGANLTEADVTGTLLE